MKKLARKSKKNPYRFHFYGALVLLLGYLLLNHFFVLPATPAESNVLGTTKADDIRNLISPLSSSPISESLKEKALEPLKETKGTYSIVIKNLKTGESFYQDEHRVYESGSLYKLWTMATVFQQLEKGTLKEDKELGSTIPALNQAFSIDPEYAELTEGSINMSVTTALKQMITISHNYAALLLTKEVKLSTVSTFLEDHSFKESKVGTNGNSPTTTAADIALFMEDLYYGRLGNPDSTKKMLDLLKEQQLKKKLPKYLPQEVEIAHKTGEIGMFSHDAGIVYTPKGDYIIVVLSETAIPAAAEDRIALISKAVYEFFTQ